MFTKLLYLKSHVTEIETVKFSIETSMKRKNKSHSPRVSWLIYPFVFLKTYIVHNNWNCQSKFHGVWQKFSLGNFQRPRWSSIDENNKHLHNWPIDSGLSNRIKTALNIYYQSVEMIPPSNTNGYILVFLNYFYRNKHTLVEEQFYINTWHKEQIDLSCRKERNFSKTLVINFRF